MAEDPGNHQQCWKSATLRGNGLPTVTGVILEKSKDC